MEGETKKEKKRKEKRALKVSGARADLSLLSAPIKVVRYRSRRIRRKKKRRGKKEREKREGRESNSF